jgi:hypothetical protein
VAVIVLAFLAGCESHRNARWADTLPIATGGGVLPYLIGAALDEAFPDTSKPYFSDASDRSTACATGRGGDGAARSSIAWHYRNGWPPVSKDNIEAYKWFILAEAAGYEAAGQYRVDLASSMPAADISEAMHRSEAWSPTEESCAFAGGIPARYRPAAEPPPNR